MSKFAIPVSMRVTEEQFVADLRKPLEDLGYTYDVTWDEEVLILVNNYCSIGNCSTLPCNEYLNGRYFIDHYNPQLFLALASQREGDEPHIGEWFKSLKYIDFTNHGYEKDEIFKILSVDNDSERGKGHLGSQYCRYSFKKLNKEELIMHFNTNKKIKGYKLIKPEYEKTAKMLVGEDEDSDWSGLLFDKYGDWYKTLEKAGVLDLWFEAVYYEEDQYVSVDCDQGEFSVKITPKGFEFEGNVVPLTYIKGLVNQMTSQASVGGWKVSLTTVSIGCKTNITLDSLHNLIDAHGKY